MKENNNEENEENEKDKKGKLFGDPYVILSD